MTLVATIAAAAVYEVAVAVKWISLGSEPGEQPLGEGLALTAGALAMIGALAYFVRVLVRERPRYWVDALIPIAGAGLMVAHFYAFDPYFLPDLQRYSENEYIAPAWVHGLAASAVVSSILMMFWGRGGRGIALVVLLLSLGTLVLEGGGH